MPQTKPPAGEPSKPAQELAQPTAVVGSPGHAVKRDDCCVDGATVNVQLLRQAPQDAEHEELNTVIRYQLESMSFDAYKKFMDTVIEHLEKAPADLAAQFGRIGGDLGVAPASVREAIGAHTGIKIHGTLAYEVLRMATEAFLLTRCGPTCLDFQGQQAFVEFVKQEDPPGGETPEERAARVRAYLRQFVTSESAAATPYLDTIVRQLDLHKPSADPLVRLYASRWQCPMLIELIWSYWHEEAMQVQTMNAIAIRFQNRRSRVGNDPLAALEIDPLRPLNNLLWGWIQAEYKRLSVQRRAYEYDHHYGLTLMGKAVPPLLSADSRSKFLEAFHVLLWEAHDYYDQSANTTVIPQGFPLANALRSLHLILSEGAHNQYGDLPWTSRVEMLIEQWFLSRAEMREFLRGRAMVPYMEPWMGQVDTMKKLQGWTDVTVTHFHELATCGEALLLAVRHGPWAKPVSEGTAKAWADYWRNEVQRYIYSYKAVTGTDLTIKPQDNTMPSRLLNSRLARQQAAALR